jgi:hypothetical protein
MRHRRPDLFPRRSSGDPAELAPSVLRFADHLRRLPLGVWADLATRVEVGGSPEDAATRGALARARLRRIVDELEGVGRVRQRVQGLAATAEGMVHPTVARRMKKVALTAAFALAARPQLGEEDFERLYAPFATAIPLEQLSELSSGPSRGEAPGSQLS